MKILKNILSILIWVIVGLYLVIILTFSIPAVQEYLGRKAAGVLAEQLGTSVSIGRLDYGFLSHVTLYDVNVKDQEGLDMLKAARLSTRIDLLPLLQGKISISTAQLFSVHAKLRQKTADSKPNFQFVIDSLASKDTTSTSPLHLRINSLIMRHSSVTYDRMDAAETPGILNPRHLSITNLSSHIILKELSEDSLDINIKRLSFKEKSGLEVNRLSMHFDAGRDGARLSDFKLQMPGSELVLGDILANYIYRDRQFIARSLRVRGSILPSTVTLSDLSYLLPSLKTFQSTLFLESQFRGARDYMEIQSLKVGSTTGDININLSGSLSQLGSAPPFWKATIHDLGLSAKTISFISENLQGQRVQVPEELVRMGNIHLTGIVSGIGDSELQAHNQLSSDAGNMTLRLSMDSLRHFKGLINTDGFNLRQVLNNDDFGTLAATLQLDGHLPKDLPPTIRAEGVVKQFSYHDYVYQNILVNGQYNPSDIHGKLSIDDNNIQASIEGSFQQKRRQKDVQVTVNVERLAPQAIHLSDKWGDARFSGTLLANFKAQDVNDAIGIVDLKEFTMQSANDHYRLEQLHIESGYHNDTHYMNMESDFATARLTGNFDYKTLAQSFTNFIATRLPTMPGLPKANTKANNNFAIEATVTKSDWLQHVLQVPLELTEPMTISGNVNDQTQQMNIECNIPHFSYKDDRYEQCHASILSPLGTLSYDLSIVKLIDDGDPMNIQVSGNAFNNQLTSSLQWDNYAEQRMSGKITARGRFDTTLDGHQIAFIDLAPSTITIMNAQWDINPSAITYYDKHLEIDKFSMQHEEQFLTLDGVASDNSQDSILVRMRDLDIEYILDLVDFDAVSFSGKATGGGSLRNLFGNFEADGRLTVNHFEFEHGRMGTLDAQVTWNKEQEQIDILATADDGPDAQTYIEGYVSPKRNFIDLNIEADGTHLDFARSFMDSFISRMDGHANGSLRLMGQLDALNLTGQLAINGLAHVSVLGCDYELRGDTITLIPNEITLTHFPIYDINGTEAMLSGAIHHNELTDLTFDLNVTAENLLAYHFSNFGSEAFYGTVYASGDVSIRGRDEGVTIEADITPQRGSKFVYNAASPEAISNQEFIQWGPAHPTAAKTAQPATEWRSDLRMLMKINVNPQAELQLLMDAATKDYITLRGSGMLQVSYYNKGSFDMFGTYRVTEGTYGLTIQNVIRKNFTFTEGGTIIFSGDPYDANLHLQATHIVNGVSLSDLNVGQSFSNMVRVKCLMNISGQPSQPILDFDLEMPNVNADEQQMVRSIINSEEEMNQQVLYLLAVGRFYPQGANNAESSGESRSKTSLAMQSLLSGTLSGQINGILSKFVKSNHWNFGANISTGDEGWNNAEYEGIVNGRLLNNRLLFNGQFGYRDNVKTATPSFIGDFDLRYLLLPNGNLALKVYNQSNDRYFTRSSLNTQGLGIIIKKDFNGLSDFFGIKKKKKKAP